MSLLAAANACSKDDQVLSDHNAEGVCQGGSAYSCSSFQPQIVNDTFSYGFAGHGNTASAVCCQCFKFTWTDNAAKGKTMVVQAVNAGGLPSADDFDIYTPGGGVGDFPAACNAQYGAPAGTGWGRQYGGVSSDSECSELPSSLQEGCHWRWQWGGGDLNLWNIVYEQVECPTELTSISGCSA
ncbi:glycoside hydrolase family 45 protein [Saccharata proteae CBS 121410]|uniref:cellulase n=1 Tax=Saccharata proteae CBS 121410 TaxID=1314787 RepID=A0A9P4LZ11_9PEZI|nr:glycoside hydrolase family 45 protein [Saccharata proteae CBS 121410]